MKIVSENIKEIKIIIECVDDIDKAFDYAEKKLKNFKVFWGYDLTKEIVVFKKAKLRKCDICKELDVCNFEFEDGEKVYKICGTCWARLNS